MIKKQLIISTMRKEEAEDLLGMQMSSKAYLDWLSPGNDIYDEVFKDYLHI